MECYICEEYLNKIEATDYVCICNKCLELMEKTEARMVQKICEQRKALEMNKERLSKYTMISR